MKKDHPYYTTENFPNLVAHANGWNIYAASEQDENGKTQCAAIAVTTDRVSHAYGTTDYVSRRVQLGHLRPVFSAPHLALS